MKPMHKIFNSKVRWLFVLAWIPQMKLGDLIADFIGLDLAWVPLQVPPLKWWDQELFLCYSCPPVPCNVIRNNIIWLKSYLITSYQHLSTSCHKFVLFTPNNIRLEPNLDASFVYLFNSKCAHLLSNLNQKSPWSHSMYHKDSKNINFKSERFWEVLPPRPPLQTQTYKGCSKFVKEIFFNPLFDF